MKFFDTAAGAQPAPQTPSPRSAPPPSAPIERPLDPERAWRHDLDLAHAHYGKAIGLMRQVVSKAQQGPQEFYGEVRQIVQELLKLTADNNQALLLMGAYSTREDYLLAHCVNICILALHVGLRVYREHAGGRLEDADNEQLFFLGVTALLQDIGVLRKFKLLSQARTPPQQEAEESRLHPMEARRLVDHVAHVQEASRAILLEVTGRAPQKPAAASPKNLTDARNFPLGSQIIGLCDILETATHHRPWRRALPAHDVIMNMTKEHRDQFDPRIFKCLLEALSIYPPGSFVVLSNGDLARSIGSNPQLLTRPILEIWGRKSGKRELPPAFLNLASTPLTYIMKITDETMFWTRDPSLLQDMAAAQWWQQSA